MNEDIEAPLAPAINSEANIPADPPMPEAAPPQPVPEETSSTLSEGQPAKEEHVFLQDLPANPNISVLKSMFCYCMATVALVSLCYLALGFQLVRIYHSGLPDFSGPLIAITVMFALYSGVEFFAMLLNQPMFENHFANFMDALGSLIISLDFCLYLSGNLGQQNFKTLLVVNLVFQVVKFAVKKKAPAGVLLLLLNIIQAASVLLVGFKLVEPEEYFSWRIILIYYTVLYYFSIALITILVIIKFVLLSILLFQPNFFIFPKKFLALIFAFLHMLICLMAFGAVFYLAVRPLLEKNKIQPLPIKRVKLPKELLWSGHICMAAAAFALLFSGLLFFLQDALIRALLQIPLKEISLKTYASAFQLKLRAMSGRVFKRAEAGDKPVVQDSIPMDSCVICQTQPSSYLFTPCQHALVCGDCIAQFVRTVDKCPICSEGLKVGYHIAFDEGLGNYVVDLAYKIQRK